MVSDTERTAQELIAGIYGHITKIRENGKTATAIVLPVEQYRILQDYRSSLGEVGEGLPDYLGKYDLFGIPLYTDNGTDVIIKSKRVEREE